MQLASTSEFCVFVISVLTLQETPTRSQSLDRPCLLPKSYTVKIDDTAYSQFALALQNVLCENCHPDHVEIVTAIKNTSTASLVLHFDDIRGKLSFLVSGRVGGEGVRNYLEEDLAFAMSNVKMRMTVKLAKKNGDWRLTTPVIDRLSFSKSVIPGLFWKEHRLVEVLKSSLYNVLVGKCIYPRVLRLKRFKGPADNEPLIKAYIDKKRQEVPFLESVLSVVKEKFRGTTREEISIRPTVRYKGNKLHQIRAMIHGLDTVRLQDDIEFQNISYEYRYDVKANMILGPVRVVLEPDRFLQENVTISVQTLSASLRISESKDFRRQKTLQDLQIGKTASGIEYSRSKLFSEDRMQSVFYGLLHNIEAKYRHTIEEVLPQVTATLH